MKPMRIGMIGYGGIGRVHAMAYRSLPYHYGLPAESIQLVGVATASARTAQAAAGAGHDRVGHLLLFGVECVQVERSQTRHDVSSVLSS